MLKDFILHLAMPLLKLKLRLTRHVYCELTSIVHPSCKFEGFNRVCRGTYISRSYMGYGSYVGNNCNIVSTKVGNYTCIGPYVRTTSGVHPTDFVSMHPAFYSTRGQVGFTYVTEQKFDEKADRDYYTLIGNDVWIGDSVLLVQGVNIGDGAVVAAGAIVTKDVPPYAVVAGIPAKVIRYRFSEDEVKKLLGIRWWDKSQEWIAGHADEFENTARFIESFDYGVDVK